MGKGKKSSKKFAQKGHLQGAIQRRRQVQKIHRGKAERSGAGAADEGGQPLD